MKTISIHAATAKAIRAELKKQFPLTQFNVRARSFSGGDAVDVEWIDGPTYKTVMKMLGKYQYGKFDGMTDCYDMTNLRNDVPQVKYVQVRREISNTTLQQVFSEIQPYYAGWENIKSVDETSAELMNKWNFWTAREFILRKILNDMDLTNGYQKQ